MKWLIVLIALGAHAAYAAHTPCAESLVCLTCLNADSYEDCLAGNNYVQCPQSNPVCEVEWHINLGGDVIQFTSKCKQETACIARTTGPAKHLCNDTSPPGLGGERRKRSAFAKRGPQFNSICRECRPGICPTPTPTPPTPTPTDCDEHCFTCCGNSDLVCWITGQYKACPPGSICFERTKNKGSHHERYTRGCKEISKCSLDNNSTVEQEVCDDSGCLKCTNEGVLHPDDPRHEVMTCGEPDYRVCSCKGDPHCDNYDMVKFSPRGLCKHVLTTDGCGGASTFTVLVDLKNVGNDKIAVQGVMIMSQSHTITLGKEDGWVDVDGTKYGISSTDCSGAPENVSGIEICSLKDGAVVRVTLPSGVEVYWDFKRAVSVYVPKTFDGNLCGLCGDANDDPSNDLTFGNVEHAIDTCPGADSLLAGRVEGDILPEGEDDEEDITDWTYSWIDSLTDGPCDDFCTS